MSQFLVYFFKDVLCKYMHIQYTYTYIYVLFLQWWELTPGLHTHILFKMAVFLNPQVVDIA